MDAQAHRLLIMRPIWSDLAFVVFYQKLQRSQSDAFRGYTSEFQFSNACMSVEGFWIPKLFLIHRHNFQFCEGCRAATRRTWLLRFIPTLSSRDFYTATRSALFLSIPLSVLKLGFTLGFKLLQFILSGCVVP